MVCNGYMYGWSESRIIHIRQPNVINELTFPPVQNRNQYLIFSLSFSILTTEAKKAVPKKRVELFQRWKVLLTRVALVNRIFPFPPSCPNLSQRQRN